jgi:predicted transcriptional regulator YdeE
MTYEIVSLEEKTVVGVSARTNNLSPDMTAVIGGLWNAFFSPDIYPAIEHKTSEKALGIYTDYAGDEKADYSVVVACEVSEVGNLPQGTLSRTIPAGQYAKFIVRGDLHQVVGAFWQKLWTLNLPRSFVSDFEEYQNADPDNAEIHIYIGLKD